MLPIRDINTARRPHYATLSLILLNFAVFAYQCFTGLDLLGLSPSDAEKSLTHIYGVVPQRFIAVHDFRELGTIFTSMFLHAHWFHILGNMWFLHIFGDNVEDHLGHFEFLAFYLVCGVFAEAAELFVNPGFTGPCLGASGAIAGVIGAYLILHPSAKMVYFAPHRNPLTRMPALTLTVPAWIAIGEWIVLQVVGMKLTDPTADGIAYAAHMGGFSAGLCVYFLRPKEQAGPEQIDYEALDLRPPPGLRSPRWGLFWMRLAILACIGLAVYWQVALVSNTALPPAPAHVESAPPKTQPLNNQKAPASTHHARATNTKSGSHDSQHHRTHHTTKTNRHRQKAPAKSN